MVWYLELHREVSKGEMWYLGLALYASAKQKWGPKGARWSGVGKILVSARSGQRELGGGFFALIAVYVEYLNNWKHFQNECVRGGPSWHYHSGEKLETTQWCQGVSGGRNVCPQGCGSLQDKGLPHLSLSAQSSAQCGHPCLKPANREGPRGLRSNNCTSRNLSKGYGSAESKGCTHPNVYGSAFNNSQIMERA